MRRRVDRLTTGMAAILAGAAIGAAEPPGPRGPQEEATPKPAEAATAPEGHAGEPGASSRVAAVTVYPDTALVSREVQLPAGEGVVELVVGPLPAGTIDSSLYAEATGDVRVLSTRYRTRAVREDAREEVRQLEAEIEGLRGEERGLQSELSVAEQDLALLEKLEGFTSATLAQLTDKGALDAAATIELATHIMTSRGQIAARRVEINKQLAGVAGSIQFAGRRLAELSAGSSRTERDALIAVERAGGAPGTVRLNYLVSGASWRPQYRFTAGGEDEPVRLEYLAAVVQQTGEDWSGVELTLSTSQPRLNAAPPPLLALDVSLAPAPPEGGMMAGGMGGMGGGFGGMGAMGGTGPGGQPGQQGQRSMKAQIDEQSRSLREQAQQELLGNRAQAGGALMNQAAALEQAGELLAAEQPPAEEAGAPAAEAEPEAGERGGPSVTFRLPGRRDVPSRTDQQLVEVERAEQEAVFYYRAIPVLTPHVYRLANLVNSGRSVLLPGEASVYVGPDFVGRMELAAQVAVGEPFTVGFGADPQLQVHRKQVDSGRTTQGGNQVLSYDYRIRAGSYKPEPVRLEVWDRMPRADGEQVAIGLVASDPPLSEDASYLRRHRPENLLRWDVTVAPGQHGDDALAITYAFKMEFARGLAIQGLTTGDAGLSDEAGAGGFFGGAGGAPSAVPAPPAGFQ